MSTIPLPQLRLIGVLTPPSHPVPESWQVPQNRSNFLSFLQTVSQGHPILKASALNRLQKGEIPTDIPIDATNLRLTSAYKVEGNENRKFLCIDIPFDIGEKKIAPLFVWQETTKGDIDKVFSWLRAMNGGKESLVNTLQDIVTRDLPRIDFSKFAGNLSADLATPFKLNNNWGQLWNLAKEGNIGGFAQALGSPWKTEQDFKIYDLQCQQPSEVTLGEFVQHSAFLRNGVEG